MVDSATQPKSAVKPSRVTRAPNIAEDLRKIINKRPHLKINSRGHSLRLTFEFQASIPHTLRKKAPQLCDALLGVKEHQAWVDTLLKVHSHSLVKKEKAAKVWLRRGFRKLLLDALSHLLAKSKVVGKKYEPSTKKQFDAIEQFRRKRLPVHNRRHGQKKDALAFANRHKELLPQVTDLRNFIADHRELPEPELRLEIEKHPTFGKRGWLRLVTRGNALQHMPVRRDYHEPATTDLKGNWTSWQLSVGIIYCEEEAKVSRMRLSPNTIYYKYILCGNRIIKNNSSKKTSS